MTNRIKIRLLVKRPNDFLKKLIEERINIYDIKQRDKELVLTIDTSNLKKIINSKTIKEYEILNYYGKERIKRRMRKYIILIISILLGILSNLFLSQMILKIEIKTTNQDLQNQIQKDLYFLGLKPFHLKLNQKQIAQLKKELSVREKDKIEWLEIENQGTKYIITIEEKKKKKQELCPNRNIIAKKKAMIKSVESSSGEIIKKKYDYVEKGEVIISGSIHNKDNIVSYKCAKGKVLGETWYKVTIELPEEVSETEKTNIYKWHIGIEFGKKNPSNNRWNVLKEYNIVKSNIYPFKISLLYLQKVKNKRIKYTLKNVDHKAFTMAEKELEKHLGEEPKVIRKKVLKKSLKNSKIIIEVFFALEEDITSYQPIQGEMRKEE